jgi:hypothetical protein
LPQDDVLLTGERDKNVSFSSHLKTKDSFNIPVEEFLAMCCFENSGKLDDLGLEIGPIAHKSGD